VIILKCERIMRNLVPIENFLWPETSLHVLTLLKYAELSTPFPLKYAELATPFPLKYAELELHKPVRYRN
jgi:hypothetical protein